jgi:hypothetical protein
MAPLEPRNPEDLMGRHHHQECAAGLAPVVGIDSVVGLLLAHELERLVLAGRHRREASGMGFRRLEAEE